jgi:hypothetical protein
LDVHASMMHQPCRNGEVPIQALVRLGLGR